MLLMHIRSYIYISTLEFHIVMAQRIANTNHTTTDMAICKYQPC